MTDIVEIVKSRIGEEFDGECHLSEEEGLAVCDIITRLRSELAKANDGARIATELLAEAVEDYNDALAELAQARKTERKDDE